MTSERAGDCCKDILESGGRLSSLMKGEASRRTCRRACHTVLQRVLLKGLWQSIRSLRQRRTHLHQQVNSLPRRLERVDRVANLS